MRRYTTLWNASENALPVRYSLVLLKYELARDLGYGRQQPLWQKQVTVGLIVSVDFESRINECQTGVA